MFDVSLAFLADATQPDNVQTIIESSAVIATSITALIMALRAKNKKKATPKAKPAPRRGTVAATLSQDAIDEIGARR